MSSDLDIEIKLPDDRTVRALLQDIDIDGMLGLNLLSSSILSPNCPRNHSNNIFTQYECTITLIR